MEKETRNRIQRATQAARQLLEEEYREQLEGVYDILLDGTIAPQPGEHLSETQRVVREKLLAAVAHKGSSGLGPAEAVAAYLREAAFTMLNRFVALKMLEARGLVQECVSRGDQSAGFREFTALAPGLMQLPDHGYRVYIEALFDEIGREVRVLFDRHSPAGLLWPRRQTLLDLVGVLNDAEMTSVWGEDETIGWVYQYFNGDEDRQKARYDDRGKRAPQSGRDLAVRNQFFTPRYVVEFLTDNTLGRTWYDMRQGNTRLRNECRFLFRSPLDLVQPGNDRLAAVRAPDEALSEKGSGRRATPPEKDPRDIRVLDPACGSGHFLLYAFDLLTTIYEEAWSQEDGPPSAATGRRLSEDYLTIDDLRRQLPGLVLTHNLHGIDIDTRAAQIAAFALWMRAQRAYRDFGVSRSDRPAIAQTNIVVAEPMPGEKGLRAGFLRSLDEELGRLAARVFSLLELADQAGSLLRIEDELHAAIREIYGQYGELFRTTDEQRWSEAEERLLTALRIYAEQTESGLAYKRRLFVGDAARGFAFIDACRRRYDVVLMNPPFGDVTEATRPYLYEAIPSSTQDICAAFVERFRARLEPHGVLGALLNRMVLFNEHLQDWRLSCLLGEQTALREAADLGYGVLDAVVETVALVCGKNDEGEARVVEVLGAKEKSEALSRAVKDIQNGSANPGVHIAQIESLRRFPAARIAYTVSRGWIARLDMREDEAPNTFVARFGAATGDNFRFLRLFWEVEESQVGARWHWFSKGGSYSKYRATTHLVADWQSASAFRRLSNPELYEEIGATYTYRTTSNLSVRALPGNSLFSYGGPGLVPIGEGHPATLLAYMNSFVATYVVELMVGMGDYSARGTAARNIQPAHLQFVPRLDASAEDHEWFDAQCKRLDAILSFVDMSETDPFFEKLPLAVSSSLHETVQRLNQTRFGFLAQGYKIVMASEERIARLLELSPEEVSETHSLTGYPLPCGTDLHRIPREQLKQLSASDRAASFDRDSNSNDSTEYRFENKLSHYLHAGVEAAAHRYSVSPAAVCEWLACNGGIPQDLLTESASLYLSAALGCCFGRWSPTDWRHSNNVVAETEPFRDLPTATPGQRRIPENNHDSKEILVDDEGHPSDCVECMRESLVAFSTADIETLEDQLCGVLSASSRSTLRQFVRRGFFDEHVARYSKSRRKAPIYWQLATPSTSYSVWLYYHRLTRDTFFKILNDYVVPKGHHEERKLTSLTQDAAGSPTSGQRSEIAEQESLVEELRTFRGEVARVAPLWNPDLNDGVIINFAPLWRLVPQHKAWQKECKKVWDKLVAGDYDWAHLAMHLWPGRVVPKCAKDRSLAIAHGLEEVFWREDDNGKWQSRDVEEAKIAVLVQERTAAAVKAALDDLLTAPTLVARKAKKGRRRSSSRKAKA